MTQPQRLCLQLATSRKGQKPMAESYFRKRNKLSSQLESFDAIVLFISFVNGFAEALMFLRKFNYASACWNLFRCDRLGNQPQDEEVSLNFSCPGNRQTSLRQVDLALAAQELIAIHKNDFGDRFAQVSISKAYLTQECTIAFASHKAISKRDSQGSDKISCEVASWTARKCCEVLQTIPPTMKMMRHAVLLRVKARFALRFATLHYDLDTRTAYTALTLAAGQLGGDGLQKTLSGKKNISKNYEKVNAFLGRFLKTLRKLFHTPPRTLISTNSHKEEFSYAYIHAVAAAAGYSCEKAPRLLDLEGIDLTVTAVGTQGSRRCPRIDLQVKCTSKVEITEDEHIKYRLRVEDYERLIFDDPTIPYYLVVVVVPDEVDDWLIHSENEILLKRCGYWKCLAGEPPTKNTGKITVPIPRINLFTPSVLKGFMEHLGGRKSA